LKSLFPPAHKTVSALATFGTIVAIACTPMAALAHTVAAHGNNPTILSTLMALLGK
jgi:hypothetical protein